MKNQKGNSQSYLPELLSVSESELLESEELLDDDAEISESFFFSYGTPKNFSETVDTALSSVSSDLLSSCLSDMFWIRLAIISELSLLK